MVRRSFLTILALAWIGAAFYTTASGQGPGPEARVGGPELPGGGRIQCELPGDLHRRNTESKGLGLCVWTSLHHAAIYQNVPQLVEFPKYLINQGVPGGGYPTKVSDLVKKISRDRGMPEPDYIQVEDADLEVLRAACRSGRMVSCTYGKSPTGRYGGQAIAHMVNLVHADSRAFVILDNNWPGSSAYEHLSPEEFLASYRTTPDQRGRAVLNRAGWSVILLNSSPPPAPVH